ncbi:MAG: hypothetical protein JW751_16300 [Polyangiaceae bacterium]|nr:hypothetical protein [Polyangiaceae bacterium]
MAVFRLRRTVLASFASFVVLSGPVRSQEVDGGSVSIDWRAPSSCPERAQVEGDVIRLLGGTERDRSDAEPFVARADVVQQADGRWHLVLSTLEEGRPGTQERSAESCAALANATALIVGMMIDPEIMTRLDGSDAAEERKRAPATAGTRTEARPTRAPPSPRPRRSASWRGFAGPVLATHTGLAPRWPLAGGVRLGRCPGRSLIGLEGLYSPKTVGQSPVDPALRGRFSLVTAGVRWCQTSRGRSYPLGPS